MKILLSLLTFIFISLQIFAQNGLVRRFATQNVQERLQTVHPDMLEKQRKMERYIRNFQHRRNFKKIKIPVVFHILYASGQTYPDQAQVQSQIDALNRDFDKQAPDIRHQADTLEGFVNRAAKIDINFCLPKEDPNGNNTNGINFIQTNIFEWNDNDAIKSITTDGVDAWDTDRYLNIWVANLTDSVSGYAQMPGGPVTTDGIVIDYRFFGTIGTAVAPYNEGKTLTHLVGNYLGLYDLWNEKMPCMDDFVEDTPIHNAPNKECYEYKHISTCKGYPVEMSMNYMDNSKDACMYMFTNGQKIRMQAVLEEEAIRGNLSKTETKCNGNNNRFALVEESNPVLALGTLQMKITPNPANTSFLLSVKHDELQTKQLAIQIKDVLGKTIYHEKEIDFSSLYETQVNTSNWNPGTYIVEIKLGNQLKAGKVVITH